MTVSLTRDINLLRKERVQRRGAPINPLYNAWSEIDLASIKHNISVLKNHIGKDTNILAVIKADAYGHGLREVSRTMIDNAVRWLGVTSIAEALELRRLYRGARILILSAGMYAHSKLIVKHDLTPIVCSRKMAALLNDAAKERGKRIKIHVKIDTGMGRLGPWHENALSFIKDISTYPYIELEGICSHFATISSSEVCKNFMQLQFDAFSNVVESLREEGIEFPIKHIGNSGAAIAFKESYLDMIRLGISIYGQFPSKEIQSDIVLRPALSLKSRVAYLKDISPGRTVSYGCTYKADKKTRIATIPIGYSNGYCRKLSNKGQVIIKGKRAPVVGIVTMDQIMVDVGHIQDVVVGNEVVLIGKQMGEEITASEVAQWANTISYEVLCKLNVPRVYFE